MILPTSYHTQSCILYKTDRKLIMKEQKPAKRLLEMQQNRYNFLWNKKNKVYDLQMDGGNDGLFLTSEINNNSYPIWNGFNWHANVSH